MAKSSRRPSTSSSKSSKSSKGSSSSRDSASTAASYKTAGSSHAHSTKATSTSSSSRSASKAAKVQQQPAPVVIRQEDDISPSTSCCPRSSVDTYNSEVPSDVDMEDDTMRDTEMADAYYDQIPPLPAYRREVADPTVRPSSPKSFARSFPSMNRLSIRHDDFTSDGNMNLRVETVAPNRRRETMQLFHLRMYDLSKREFSLRRYCRESGREVCNSKRKYVAAPVAADSRGSKNSIQKSVSSAFKFKRTNSGGSLFGHSSKSSNPASPSSSRSSNSSSSKHDKKRPGSSSSSGEDGDDEFNDYFSRTLALDRKSQSKHRAPIPSNTIKLEFSNYARVDVSRRGGRSSKRYEFEWWGHTYAWKRVTDKNVPGVVSFHLIRDGAGAPVAHIVPETRSPTQVAADEDAGGWVPPCYMWISDRAVIDSMTDVADVVVATGLMALVDDCIKERWQTRSGSGHAKKVHRIAVPLTSKSVDVQYSSPKAFVQNIFHRRESPLRFGQPISAY